ncbi:MAG: hypothetical protein II129_03980, partial [Paludibacteraceae bacterium]|nr:hypothetical protein [Paludibacteraceae bacterium]
MPQPPFHPSHGKSCKSNDFFVIPLKKNGDINVYGYGQSMTFRIVISSRKLKFAHALQQQKTNG